MHNLAPIAIALLLSGALYTTKEVWNLDLYKLQNLAWEDTKQFQKAVNQGKIPAEAAEFAFRAKWEGGAAQADVQGYVDKWVDFTKRSKASAGTEKAAVQFS